MSITEKRAVELARESRAAFARGVNTMVLPQSEARGLRISRLPGDDDCEVAVWAVNLALAALAERHGWALGRIRMANAVRAAFEQIERLRTEIERLRALTTITDDMVERAAEALFYTMGQESDGACWISEWEGWTVIDGTFDMPSAMRAALEAALTPKENEA